MCFCNRTTEKENVLKMLPGARGQTVLIGHMPQKDDSSHKLIILLDFYLMKKIVVQRKIRIDFFQLKYLCVLQLLIKPNAFDQDFFALYESTTSTLSVSTHPLIGCKNLQQAKQSSQNNLFDDRMKGPKSESQNKKKTE